MELLLTDLSQLVQRQNALHGRDAFDVFLDVRFAVRRRLAL